MGGLERRWRAELLLDAAGAARAPAWSPDGRRLAYSGAATARTRIWVARARHRSGAAASPRSAQSRPAAGLVAGRQPPRVHALASRPLAHVDRPRERHGPHGPSPARTATSTPTGRSRRRALAPGPEALLPDLDQQAPADLVVIARQGGFHLGFTSAVDSIGRGPLRIRGWRPSDGRTMRADQLIELRRGGTLLVRDVGTLLYETHPPHRHWHFQQFESYELRRASDHALVGRDRKSGFCLIDRYGRASVRVPHAGPPRFVSNCGAGQRDLRRVEQGSSLGYVDRYPAFFHGQDIDVTRVPAGIYVLVHRANPTRRVRESATRTTPRPCGCGSPGRQAARRRRA